MSDMLSDMKTVTPRALRRDASLLDAAAEELREDIDTQDDSQPLAE
jgi:hypothetical protein